MNKSNTCFLLPYRAWFLKMIMGARKKSGNGLAAGCQLFYREIYGYFCSVFKKRDVCIHIHRVHVFLLNLFKELPRNCHDILSNDPTAESAEYDINPDGPGPLPTTRVCYLLIGVQTDSVSEWLSRYSLSLHF